MKSFVPDTSIASDVIPSHNCGERNKDRSPDMILLHYTGMPDVEGAIARLCNAGTDVSAHYIVLDDGRILQCVPEAKRAWHAGVASWAGEADINSCSIGIEIANPGHDWGYPDFPLRQIAAVIALCRGIMLRRNVPSHRVLGHSDVAPSRKKDPGEKFPWHSLANSGVGHWVEPAPIVRGAPVERPETVATAIRIGNPASWQGALAARDESGGAIEAVSDDEILAAYRFAARCEGVFVEPASAAAIAGLRRRAKAGALGGARQVVCVLTGNGLKDPDRARALAGEIKEVDASADEVRRVLAES